MHATKRQTTLSFKDRGLWCKGNNIFAFSDGYFDQIYTQFRDEAPQELGRRVYRYLVSRKFGNDGANLFIEEHKEVRVLVVKAAKEGDPYVIIKTNVLPTYFRFEADYHYIFIIEYDGAQAHLKVVGGIIGSMLHNPCKFFSTGSVARDNSIVKESEQHWLLDRQYAREDLYDEKTFAMYKDRRSAFIRAVDPQKYPLSVYADIEEESRKEESRKKDRDLTHFDRNTLSKWIEERFDLMVKFQQVGDKHLKMAEKMEALHDVIGKGMYFGALSEWFNLQDVTGHMGAVMATIAFSHKYQLEEPSELTHWIVRQESDIAKFRIQNLYLEEDGILDTVNKLGKFQLAIDVPDDIITICVEMFKRSYNSSISPKRWYIVPFYQCTRVFMELDCFVQDGLCYLSYKHFQNFILPDLAKKSITSHYMDKKTREKVIQAFVSNPRDGAFCEVIYAGFPLLRKINANLVKEKEKKQELMDGVGDIEDSISKHLFPPCVRHLDLVLKTKHHLKYHERMQIRSILLDIGYSGAQILTYLEAQFKKGGMTEEKFKKEFSELVKTTRPAPWASKCQKYASPEYITSVGDNKSGCPFATMKSGIISQLLMKMGVVEEETNKNIVHLATVKKQYRYACFETFKSIHGNVPRGVYVNGRPEKFFAVAVNQRKKLEEAITAESKKRVHIELEFESDDFMEAVSMMEQNIPLAH